MGAQARAVLQGEAAVGKRKAAADRPRPGRDTDKFAAFGLTQARAKKVEAPLVAECFENLECRLADARLVRMYNFFFFFELMKAHAATAPRYPRTIHYRGDGVFMISGSNTSRYRGLFRREML